VSKNTALRCRVVKDTLTIEIGIDTLKKAAQQHEGFWQPFTDKCAIVVSNPKQFANAVKSKLLDESEDGSTPLHILLDKAIEEAVEYGCDGLDYDAMEAIEKAETLESSPPSGGDDGG
jgi:hypothetical protein